MRIRPILLLTVAVCILSVGSALAQSYAITNAKVVTVSGATIENGTIVIRNGLIEAVGANLSAPADATILNAAGLTVYPGFFDTLTSLGIPARPAAQGGGGGGGGQAAAAAAATPQQPTNSNYPVGLRPEENVQDDLREGEAQFEASRNAGITTALTVGRTGIFNGQSAIINLAGDSVSNMIVRAPFAMHISLVPRGGGGGGGGGGYPGSLLGTFSSLRQMFSDARRLQEIQRLYTANPRGIKRPEADRSLEALFPVIDRRLPVVISANSELEINRALDFFKEHNLVGIIAGGQEADKATARLKAQNVPVLFSLNLPKRTTASSPDADPETLDMLRFRVAAQKTAAALASSGIKFAFHSGGATAADFFTNAGKAVQNGLSRDAAIRAMTLGAAEVLGVDDRLGSIEVGKIANLAVVKGDIFGTDRFAAHVFVDGKHFEQKEPVRPAGGGPGGRSAGGAGAPAPAGTISLSGVYSITIDVPGQPLPATLNFAHEGTTLTGSMVSALGTSTISNGRVTGTDFNFTTSVTFGGTQMDISVQGSVTGNQVKGTVDSPQGNVPFSGTKTP